MSMTISGHSVSTRKDAFDRGDREICRKDESFEGDPGFNRVGCIDSVSVVSIFVVESITPPSLLLDGERTSDDGSFFVSPERLLPSRLLIGSGSGRLVDAALKPAADNAWKEKLRCTYTSKIEQHHKERERCQQILCWLKMDEEAQNPKTLTYK